MNLDEQLSIFMETSSTLKSYKKEKAFVAYCMKYFFFNERFDPDEIDDYIVDGANDGGIDAVFNDPNSDTNDMIIVQCKYFCNAELTPDSVVADISKIITTIKSFESHTYSTLNRNVQEAYLSAYDDMHENGNIKIFYFSSYELKTIKSLDRYLKKIANIKNGYDISLNFYQEVINQVEYVDSPNQVVDAGVLKIDAIDNMLYFGEDAVVANISAHSLKDLYCKYEKKGLFSLNLRYYIKDRKVDKGISETIRNDSTNFWFLNNGLIFLCDDFTPEGRTIRIRNFSIVNGGQTTTLIGKTDFADDFYLTAKIIRTSKKTDSEKDVFISKISSASNSQKPIKSKDLVANASEQRQLKSNLARIRIFYALKRGEVINKSIYKEPYQVTNPEQLGKLLLSCQLQQPGTARSNTNKIYSDTIYFKLFNFSTNPLVVRDLLKLEYYYDEYKKKSKELCSIEAQPMIVNGKYHTLACTFILIKVAKRLINIDNFSIIKDNPEKYRDFLENNQPVDTLFTSSLDNEQNLIAKLFGIITDSVLSMCYEIQKGISEQANISLAPSNYLKTDKNYTDQIIPKLLVYVKKSEELRKITDDLFK